MRVEGIVQGVGFRPYVFGLAASLQLDGFVGNDVGGVVIEVEGPPAAVERFLARLPCEAPPMAVVERIEQRALPARGARGFVIAPSDAAGARVVPVSPDAATCGDCLRELRDPADRRFGYAFVNCTNCGPRYTIVRDVPYDRPMTTMAGYPMCPDCRREYTDPADRRFHAQPVCCPACGPTLTLSAADGRPVTHAGRHPPAAVITASDRGLADDPIAATAALLRAGRIVAVKGLGGYHLAVDAADERAVARLRTRKHREERPLAIMVAELAIARRLCEVDDTEAALLSSPAAPIVLLRRRVDSDIALAPSVASRNRELGVMLPYTPLHHLLADAMQARPFVLTSGNRSDEPIAHVDDDARTRLAGIADAFLAHDRPIHMRVDDSVVRVVGDRPTPIRRSRGYAPRPVSVHWPFPTHVLACGAELKNTVCLAKDHHAFVSHHIGDLENYATFRSFEQAIAHLSRVFDVAPRVVAHDLHPEYLATKYALDLTDVDVIAVQHHHAHIASCLADNGVAGPVIGVAFDGTGYGPDGTIWGGEFLIADLERSERVGHLEPVPLPGGAAAIREPWRMGASYLFAAYGETPDGLAVTTRHPDRWAQVLSVAAAGVNSPLTSSAGRLFDAVSALLGVRDVASYEGQAAVELEQVADPAARGAYRARVNDGEPSVVATTDLVRAAVDDLRAGVAVPAIAMRFHRALARVVVAVCQHVHARSGLTTVALSGGVFQNVLLTDLVGAGLTAAGFHVLTHHRVPPNDGGISLGQAVVAAARQRASIT